MVTTNQGLNNGFLICLQLQLTKKILEYHESGYMEDLKDLYFRRSKCNANINDGQLQGTAEPMNFNQHAGLYLLLLVGIFVCIILMFLEHATFKWLVPYWRGKPSISFWKSYSMMFWSQVNMFLSNDPLCLIPRTSTLPCSLW